MSRGPRRASRLWPTRTQHRRQATTRRRDPRHGRVPAFFPRGGAQPQSTAVSRVAAPSRSSEPLSRPTPPPAHFYAQAPRALPKHGFCSGSSARRRTRTRCPRGDPLQRRRFEVERLEGAVQGRRKAGVGPTPRWPERGPLQWLHTPQVAPSPVPRRLYSLPCVVCTLPFSWASSSGGPSP